MRIQDLIAQGDQEEEIARSNGHIEYVERLKLKMKNEKVISDASWDHMALNKSPNKVEKGAYYRYFKNRRC